MAKKSTPTKSTTTTTGQARPQPMSSASVASFVPVVGAPIIYLDFPAVEMIRVESREGDDKPYRYEATDIPLLTVGQVVWRINRSTWSDKRYYLPGTTDEAGELLAGIKPPQPYQVTAVLHAESRRVAVVELGPPSTDGAPVNPVLGKDNSNDGDATDTDADAPSGS